MTFPDSKQIWNINEGEAGSLSTKDSAPLQVTDISGIDGLEFGVFASRDTADEDRLKKPSSSFVKLAGVTMISNLAGDYANRKYNEDNQVATLRRGFAWVKIDPNNKPTVGSIPRVSFATDIEGYLTTDLTDSEIITSGVRIERVLDTVAEVYLAGLGDIPLVGADTQEKAIEIDANVAFDTGNAIPVTLPLGAKITRVSVICSATFGGGTFELKVIGGNAVTDAVVCAALDNFAEAGLVVVAERVVTSSGMELLSNNTAVRGIIQVYYI